LALISVPRKKQRQKTRDLLLSTIIATKKSAWAGQVMSGMSLGKQKPVFSSVTHSANRRSVPFSDDVQTEAVTKTFILRSNLPKSSVPGNR
jgi:hypothetical protein